MFIKKISFFFQWNTHRNYIIILYMTYIYDIICDKVTNVQEMDYKLSVTVYSLV